jgi:transposase
MSESGFQLNRRDFAGRYRGASVAERTIGWLSQSRRMSKDYEQLCETSQTMIHAVMSRLMLRRLARV